MAEIVPSFQSPGHISIPCPPEQFAEFMAGLLGKSQIIRKTFHGNFCIDRDDIESFHSLIMTRVTEQHQATLIQFSLTMIYNDGSSVEITTINDFQTYAEIKPVICIGVSYSSIFLINFAGKSFPERQQIDVDFRISNSDIETGDAKLRNSDNIIGNARHYEAILSANSDDNDTGLIGFRISHTLRSWGVDIEALLSNHIKSLTEKNFDGFFRLWLKNWAGTICFYSAVLTIIVMSFGFMRFYLARREVELLRLGVSRLSPIEKPDDFSSKIDFLVRIAAQSETINILSIIAAFVTIAIISGFLFIKISEVITQKTPSFIVLTKRSELYRDHLMGKYQRGVTAFIISSTFAVCLNIIASILFYYIW